VLDQVVDQQLRAAGRVRADRAPTRNRSGAVDQHHGGAGHPQRQVLVDLGEGTREQQPVDLARDEVFHDLVLQALVLTGVGDEQSLAMRRGHLAEFIGVLAEMGVLAVAEHESECAGRTQPQGSRAGVGQIAEHLHGLAHSDRGSRRHRPRPVVDHVAHHRRADPGQLGHIGAGHRRTARADARLLNSVGAASAHDSSKTVGS